MFKFDFHVEENNDVDGLFEQDQDDNSNDVASENSLKCHESLKILPTNDVLEYFNIFKVNSTVMKVGNVEIQHIKSGNIVEAFAKNNSSEDLTIAEINHSDLVPGVYEGGAKIWECTDDVLSYMATNFDADYFKLKRVLDLGCGAGLLGIYAMIQGAFVQYQDYNKDVLKNITIPNVFLNKTNLEANSLEDTEFYSGDWSKYVELTKDQKKFDIILTAETIYNRKNYKKILDTLKAKLSPNGIVFLAAKIHYFGIGGGLREFERFLNEDKCFESNIIWSSTNGVRRELLLIKYKQ